jgi:hypothetical protein
MRKASADICLWKVINPSDNSQQEIVLVITRRKQRKEEAVVSKGDSLDSKASTTKQMS